MADDLDAWTQVDRAPSPGPFSLSEETAAALWQARGLLARGDYGSIPTIPRDRPLPVSPAVGATE